MTSPHPRALAELVRVRMTQEGWSLQDVADRGGIPKATVHALATRDLRQVPHPDTIVGLARGLGLSVSEVQSAIALAVGLAPADDDDPLSRRIRLSLPDLTDDDREDIAALVASMLRRRTRGR
jgi:transcriptional regulator with XRE-family HTH domain